MEVVLRIKQGFIFKAPFYFHCEVNKNYVKKYDAHSSLNALWIKIKTTPRPLLLPISDQIPTVGWIPHYLER